MKGLLFKDLFTLGKQLRILLVVLVLFSIMPGFSTSSFAVIYSAMLPITALAYDERSKWNDLALMLPYSARDIVLSKYLLGYIAVGASSLLSVIAQFALSFFGAAEFSAESVVSVIAMLCASLLMLAINLPFMIKFGVEKGRIVFLVMVALVVVLMSVGSTTLVTALSGASPLPLAIGAVLITAAANIASVMISEALFKRQRA